MKYLLLLLLIPLLGCNNKLCQRESMQESDFTCYEYDGAFVDDLMTAIEDEDFYMLEGYFADTVGVNSASREGSDWVTSNDIISFLDLLFDNIPLHSYDVDVLVSEESKDLPTIYKLTCYVLVVDEDNELKLSIALFAFAETDGEIDIVLIP